MPITRGPTAFASTISVKSNLQKSWSSNLSINNENGTSFNENFLGKNEDNDRENIKIQVGETANQELLYEPQEFEPACDSLVPSYLFPNAPTILSRLPHERYLPEESDCKTNKVASSYAAQTLQKCCRTSVKSAKNSLLLEDPTHTPDHIFGDSEQHRTDETSQLEKQYLGRERINRNSEKEVILCVEDSSSYDFRSVSEPIQGHLLHRLNEDQLISVDDMESTRIEAQSTVESKSEPSIESDTRRMKLIFEKLIMLPLEALSNPNHEASMKEALTIVAGKLSLFTDEQAKQLLELKFDFPTATNSWRDCSRTRIDCQDFLAEFEKTKSLMETSTKEGEDLKDKYSQLESKEKEMTAQLAAIQKEKMRYLIGGVKIFNQTNHLAALAEEQAVRAKGKELQITIATAKLNKLKNQWVSVQSSFI